MAADVIKYHFGKRPHRVIHQAAGWTNMVFGVSLGRQEFIVRISDDPNKINDFLKEQWVTSQVKKIGVPVAEILEVGMEVIAKPYMIQEKIQGIPGTHCTERLKIIEQLGAYAAKINSVRANGYGRNFDWSKNKLSRNSSWKEFLHGDFDVAHRISVLKKYKLITPVSLKKLLTNIRKIEKCDFNPVLNHGDLRLKNVVVDTEGKIAAILDWENCTANMAPGWELSHGLHDLGIDEKQAFLKGYGLTDKAFGAISYAIKTFNILHYADAIEETGAKPPIAFLRECRIRLKGNYDLFSL